jgi:pilus assembly protein CpaE
VLTGQEIRLVLVEDVPQVAQYVRALVSAAPGLQLLDVFDDGRRALEGIVQQRPDIVIIDALLQGKVRGLDVAHAIRKSGFAVSVVVITVPQHPVRADAGAGIDAVLQMPFNGHELATLLRTTNEARRTRATGGGTFVASVFAPKGGVGKTTIAFNLAVALAQGLGRRTALVDGSLQYGDLRALLQVPSDAPSILDLPTDRIQDSDVTQILWRDPSGIDLLLAPPRVEQAEMVTGPDIQKALSFLRRAYDAIVVDTPMNLNDTTLAFLDGSDVILQVVTYDRTTIRNSSAVAETFRAIGYPPERVQYVVNRSDSTGGLDAASLAAALGRKPEHTVVSDGRLVVESNNQGVPFVIAAPEAKISGDIQRIAKVLATATRRVATRA